MLKEKQNINKLAIELIEIISRYNLNASPIIYSAFYKAYYEGDENVRNILNQCIDLKQEDIESKLLIYFRERFSTCNKMLTLSNEYAEAAQEFIDQSTIQSEKYKHDIKFIQDEDIKNTSENFNQLVLDQFHEFNQSRELFEPKIKKYQSIINNLQYRLEKMSKVATIDYLTGVFNRREYDKYLKDYLKNFNNTKQQFCLALFDVDHFKQLNDTYGHKAGDNALSLFAKIATNTVREKDLVCRYGGEEFAIIFPDTLIEEALQIVERIRIKIASRQHRQQDERYEDMKI